MLATKLVAVGAPSEEHGGGVRREGGEDLGKLHLGNLLLIMLLLVLLLWVNGHLMLLLMGGHLLLLGLLRGQLLLLRLLRAVLVGVRGVVLLGRVIRHFASVAAGKCVHVESAGNKRYG